LPLLTAAAAAALLLGRWRCCSCCCRSCHCRLLPLVLGRGT